VRIADGWGAIEKIITALEANNTSFDTVFQERLTRIREGFERDSDSSDGSPRVLEALSKTPPELTAVTDDMFLRDTQLYLDKGLRGLYDERVAPSLYRGLSPERLRNWLEERLPHNKEATDRLLNLCAEGQRPFMKPTYEPNGGKFNGLPIQNGPLHHTHRKVIEHNAASMHTDGKAVLLRADSIAPDDLLHLHVHTSFAVPKQGGIARVVTDASKSSKKTPSYNESVDVDAHGTAYPRPKPPRLRDVADLLCRMKAKFPNCAYLHAAVVDARSAFQLYHLSFEKFKLMWTKLQVFRDAEWIQLLQGNLCGTFGDLGAGDTWHVAAAIWTEMQNLVSELWEALTYVDDMMIVAAPLMSDVRPRHREFFPEPRHTVIEKTPPLTLHTIPDTTAHFAIFDAVREARDNLACIYGGESSADAKAKVFFAFLEAIGWYYDLRYDFWFVLPLEKKIEKIAHYLFNIIPAEATKVELPHMRSLAGLLCWYSAALPLGRAFVYSLFQCRDSFSTGFVYIHPAVQRDLAMWRALIRVALVEPSILGCPIDLLRSDRLPDFFTVTDASTTTGGGAWLATTPHWVPGRVDHWMTLRWTRREKNLIQQRLLPLVKPKLTKIRLEDWEKLSQAYDHYKIPGSNTASVPQQSLTINILEFATVVFLIMSYAPLLRGSVLSIGSDNTATLCWLVRNRASCGAADNLLKLLSLTCTIYNIRLVVHHVKGVDNQLADWISRVAGIEDSDPHESLTRVDFSNATTILRSLQDWTQSEVQPDRRQVCRTLLSMALTVSEHFSMDELLRSILLLRHLPTYPKPNEERIRIVLDAYQTLVLADNRPASIPSTISAAVEAAKEWKKQITVSSADMK
jgi:hypothetical protein